MIKSRLIIKGTVDVYHFLSTCTCTLTQHVWHVISNPCCAVGAVPFPQCADHQNQLCALGIMGPLTRSLQSSVSKVYVYNIYVHVHVNSQQGKQMVYR